jgi:hypothetical protein
VTDPLELLATLRGLGVRARVVDGRLQTIGLGGAIPDDVAADLRAQKALIVAVLLGRSSGHVWARCTACGAGTMTTALAPHRKARTSWPPCRMTPRCEGRHQPTEAQLGDLPADIPAPRPQAPAPARPPKSRLLGPSAKWPEPSKTTGKAERDQP